MTKPKKTPAPKKAMREQVPLFTHISAVHVGDGYAHVFALDVHGRVWKYADLSGNGWQKLTLDVEK